MKEWSATERESFFDAIGRHRRAAWRVTLVTRAINIIVALIVAVLMAPLFYCVLALALDLINLIIPMPNLATAMGYVIDRVFNHPHDITLADALRMASLAAIPGLIWMALVLNALRGVLTLCMTFDSSDLPARVPDPTVLSEQRFANVVAEMAIAAALPAPRVFVSDSETVDAVAFGTDEQHSTIVVSRGLLALLNRAQMEGVAASLVGSIADGDMKIGLRAALSLSLFGLIARLGMALTRGNARRNVSRLVLSVLVPTRARARKLLTDIGSPLKDDDEPRASRPTDPAQLTRWQKIRPYLWLPLGGPVVMTGFLSALFNLIISGPLLSLAWRQRKYMADATAVRLTRDPETLASALQQLATVRSAPLANWAAHMSVAERGPQKTGIFGGSPVPLFPSVERRLQALGKMGAQVQKPARRHIPLYVKVIAVPLFALLTVLIAILFPLAIYLSVVMTMLFTGVPFALVHLLLRAIGHH